MKISSNSESERILKFKKDGQDKEDNKNDYPSDDKFSRVKVFDGEEKWENDAFTDINKNVAVHDAIPVDDEEELGRSESNRTKQQ